MALDFPAGSPVTGNAATVSGFGTDVVLGSATNAGDVAGSLRSGRLQLGVAISCSANGCKAAMSSVLSSVFGLIWTT